MVTNTIVPERRFVTIEQAADIIQTSKSPAEAVDKLRQLPKHQRQPREPIPEGSISLRAAGKKYGVHHTTIIKWVKKGLVPVVKRTPNWLYVDEESIRKLKENGDNKLVTS